ncbi:homocysteine S-methyltransferase family protein [Psychromonas algicola]|uniref:homocysteine S-methyltransferase family protein n=1 Tax=Psychromonas algicola TaxID=2555642 RepID=UPI001068A990|nr:homocysteine S-methyltransferase family protein [Psychromonas sp. RZ5]TEW52654.1 homocysteine S-methyltransferase family protein [Psychromonas sp. RZ5]
MKAKLTSPIILDGGMGRELQRIGAPFQQPEWSAQALIEAPHLVTQVHKSFIDAGAEVVTTNTYALVPFHIGEKRFKQEGATLVKQAALLAKEAVTQTAKIKDANLLVAGCIPPVLGSYRPDLFALEKALPLLEVLITNQQDHIDIWIAETISSIAEADMIKQRTSTTKQDTWMAFTINDDINDTPKLRSGELVYDAVKKIAGQNITALLFNCSRIEVMESGLLIAKQALIEQGIETKVQLGVYANNFPPIGDLHAANDQVNSIREDIPPTQYKAFAETWLNAGASIIGGCCGISPEHIKQLAKLK